MKIRFSHLLPMAALISMTGNTVFAAPPAGKPGMNGKMGGGGMGRGGMEKISKELGLTAAQKTKLNAIMQDSMKQRRALRDNTTLTPDQKKAKMKALRMGREKKMSAVLTPAQRKKFAAMMKAQRDKMQAMRGARKPN